MLIFRVIKIFAFIAILGAMFHVGLGLFVAFSTDDAEAMRAAARRYLGTRSSGEAIDQGLAAMFDALMYWMVARIGQSVTAKDNHRQPVAA